MQKFFIPWELDIQSIEEQTVSTQISLDGSQVALWLRTGSVSKNQDTE